MGRKPTKHLNLPPRMRVRIRGKQRYYFYDTMQKPRKELPLGKDFVQAIRKYAELEIDSKAKEVAVITFKYVADNYIKEVLPTKAELTQRDNLAELKNLLDYFTDPTPAPLDKITPQHLVAYQEWRIKRAQKRYKEAGKEFNPKAGQIRANREKALFSHIWNYALLKGYTTIPNPCRVVKGFKERGRDIYVEDEDFLAAWYAADEPMQDYLDLLYVTAQRPADVLKIKETDIKGGILFVRQNKTKKPLQIEITNSMRNTIDRILARKATYKIRCFNLLVNEEGQPLTYFAARKRFDNIRTAAGVTFQLRDLRAKALTDKSQSADIVAARKLAGHSGVKMTEHYTRNRKGEKVKPTE